MTTTNRLPAILLVSLFCATSAISQTPAATPVPPPPQISTQSIDLGHLDGVNYVNNGFGLSLSIPREWVVVTAQSRPDFKDEVKNMVRSDDAAKKSQVQASIDRSSMLLSLTKLPAGQPNNASFMLIAERIPTPAIKDGPDVLRSMKNAMAGTNFNVEFQGEIKTEQISGANFGVVTVKNSSHLGVFSQKIYVTTKHGFALQFFLTYTDSADLPAFDAIVKSVKIK